MPNDTTPTAEDIKTSLAEYESTGPDGCLRDLLDSLDAAGEHDDVAAAKATALRALFEVEVFITKKPVTLHLAFVGETVIHRSETTVVYGVLDGITNRLTDAARSRAIEEEDRAARKAVGQ